MQLQTSLLILPPVAVQEFAAPLREMYSPLTFAQGPAHITLFYPFIDPKTIDIAGPIIRETCQEIEPFEITLDRYGRFETAHLLLPADPEPITNLHNSLFTKFPDYPPYEGKFGPELIPHLTLTSFDSKEEADQIQLPSLPSFTFVVKSIHLYMGPAMKKIPWIPVSIFPLGSKK